MLSFFVDNGVRSTQIANKEEKESQKNWDVNLNFKGFISRRKKKIHFHTQFTLLACQTEVRMLKIQIYYLISNSTTNKTGLRSFVLTSFILPSHAI
jgi:hypothetical protein